MKLTLGFSPCPNDTFIFDALVNKKIDTGNIDLEVRLEDVETLNRIALENALDITKVSYGVLPQLLKDYIVLNSGSALGTGVGPLLVSYTNLEISEVKHYPVAIPGEHTTAHKLFSHAFPDVTDKIFMRYDEIEDYVLNENVTGVIIHESRFTYMKKGLIRILDLGEYWEQQTGAPIPLGGIVAKRTLDTSLVKKIDGLIKQSIEYAFSNYPVITPFVKDHSQEMEEEVMRKHIDLYVNNYSIELGDDGKNAIRTFLNIKEDKDQHIFLSH